MIVLILKIVAAISLLPFILVSIISLRLRWRIPSRNPLGVPWDQVALYKLDGSVTSASGLIKHFKMTSTGLVSAIGMIILGFVVSWIESPDAFKNIDMYYYLTFGSGLLGGWVALFSCIYDGNLVLWNILGVKPPKS